MLRAPRNTDNIQKVLRSKLKQLNKPDPSISWSSILKYILLTIIFGFEQ